MKKRRSKKAPRDAGSFRDYSSNRSSLKTTQKHIKAMLNFYSFFFFLSKNKQETARIQQEGMIVHGSESMPARREVVNLVVRIGPKGVS